MTNQPLIYCLTNEVTSNFVANALLAVGASPIMSQSFSEVKALCRQADCLVLNIGTACWRQALLMLKAGCCMRRLHTPIVLDPVGAGASVFRTHLARLLVRVCHPAIVRGNASEILALAGEKPTTHGVDSAVSEQEARDAATALARRYTCCVVVSGATDYISDGQQSATITAGSPLQTQVTGMGCVATAVIGAMIAREKDPVQAAVQGMQCVGQAGEYAAATAQGPGTLVPFFLDALYKGRIQL